MTSAWLSYFDRLSAESALHREQAGIFVEKLTDVVDLHDNARVLDFGCGFGTAAALLSPIVEEVLLWDAAPNMRAAAARATAQHGNVRLCELEADAPSNLDLIVVNSVVQYMTPAELAAWLPRWRDMLSPGGRVVLSDLISPEHGALSDLADLLRLGVRRGAPIRAVRDALGGVRNYWRTSRKVPLATITPKELNARAAEAGLSMRALPRSLTHFRSRWAALLNYEQ